MLVGFRAVVGVDANDAMGNVEAFEELLRLAKES